MIDQAIPLEPFVFVPLPFCAAFQRGAPAFVARVPLLAPKDLLRGPEAQVEQWHVARRERLAELERFSVWRPISLVRPMFSLVHPMLFPVQPMPSPAIPTPFSVEPVVVQQLNLVFGRNKPAQGESVTTKQKYFSYHP